MGAGKRYSRKPTLPADVMITTFKDIQKLHSTYPSKKIIFCSGTFDLTHAGHILFFEDCKKQGDILVVMVGDDASIKQNKGSDRPVLNQHVRLKTVASLKPVDHCFINPYEEIEGKGEVFYTVRRVFDSFRPDVWVINEDALDIPSRQRLAEKYNVQLLILPRVCPPEFESISTTAIIKKIKTYSSSV